MTDKREDIARIIESDAFDHDIRDYRAQHIAFKKADAILALLSAPQDRETDLEAYWKRECEEQREIVSRIWEQLGSPSYKELKGRSIYDLIEELKAKSTPPSVGLTDKMIDASIPDPARIAIKDEAREEAANYIECSPGDSAEKFAAVVRNLKGQP